MKSKASSRKRPTRPSKHVCQATKRSTDQILGTLLRWGDKEQVAQYEKLLDIVEDLTRIKQLDTMTTIRIDLIPTQPGKWQAFVSFMIHKPEYDKDPWLAINDEEVVHIEDLPADIVKEIENLARITRITRIVKETKREQK